MLFDNPQQHLRRRVVFGDANDRLTGWLRSDSNQNQSWELSLVGDWDEFTENAVPQARTHGPAHELTAIASQAVTHDVRGCLTALPDGREFAYDADQHLVGVTVPNGAPCLEGAHTATFDALGRRVSLSTNDAGMMTTATLVFVSSGHQIVAEYVSGTAAADPERKYLYGEYIDEPVVLIDATGSSEATDRYHSNSQYSVAALTDASDDVVERSHIALHVPRVHS